MDTQALKREGSSVMSVTTKLLLHIGQAYQSTVQTYVAFSILISLKTKPSCHTMHTSYLISNHWHFPLSFGEREEGREGEGRKGVLKFTAVCSFCNKSWGLCCHGNTSMERRLPGESAQPSIYYWVYSTMNTVCSQYTGRQTGSFPLAFQSMALNLTEGCKVPYGSFHKPDRLHSTLCKATEKL